MVRYLIFFLSPLFLSLFFSCDREEVEPTEDEEETEKHQTKIHEWVYDLMGQVYYWQDSLKNNDNPDVEDYFYDLLVQKDRFSYITEQGSTILDALAGNEKQSIGVLGEMYGGGFFVILTYRNTPAERIGLKRGDLILTVNGQPITSEAQLSSSNMTLGVDTNFDELREVNKEVKVSAASFSISPVVLDTIIPGANTNEKIGYLFYDFFTTDTNTYAELRSVFKKFRDNGVTHLVVDFRYNGGGLLRTAQLLASLIGGDAVGSDQLFLQTRYNDTVANELGDEDKLYFFSESGKSFSSIYFIVSAHTASASEVVINSLFPYLGDKMHLVGYDDRTLGKCFSSVLFEGSDFISDYGEEIDGWLVSPIIGQLYNSKQETYEGGLNVDLFASPDIFAELGSLQDPFFNRVYEHMGGITPSIALKSSRRLFPLNQFVPRVPNLAIESVK